jgi:SAM-dependent methyltransferase
VSLELADTAVQAEVRADVRFGHGGSEPYERAVRRGAGALRLVDARTRGRTVLAAIDVTWYCRAADKVDRAALARTTGPVLDVGCGPARIVRAAILTHRLALGIDLSPAAVAAAQSRGLPVLRQSVFDDVPAAGRWATVVLLDGNIGIGGNPRRLLARCRDLASEAGTILVETHEHTDRHTAFDAVLLDGSDLPSLPFPWAVVGSGALPGMAADAGLRLRESWTTGGRHFSVLERA